MKLRPAKREDAPNMAELAVVAIAFAVTFLAELPDKSMFASLVLGTRYRAQWVWTGAAAAFAVQMAIAVSAGRVLALLPGRLVDWIVAGLFLAGAAYLWYASFRPPRHDGADAAREGGRPATFLRIGATSFGIVFLAEWGDITQLTAANLAAAHNPLLVFAGATAGLWTVAAVAVSVGAKSLALIPMAWVSRITGLILLALACYSAAGAVR